MGIIVCLGLPGSGKTAATVREMVLNSHKKIYTNIIPKKPRKTPHIKKLDRSMIVSKEMTGYKGVKNPQPVYELKLNQDFWKGVSSDGPIDCVLDEIHTMLDARKFGSKLNKIMTDFLALIRRVLGQSQTGHGDLYLITQLDRRLDVIGREMATQIRYHVCHYSKMCMDCNAAWNESSETPEPYQKCPRCSSHKLKRYAFYIEIWKFQNMQAYQMWREFGAKMFYDHHHITDIEDYFQYYDTMQWENLISEY